MDYKVFLFLHILFVVLFVGSGAALALLWQMFRNADLTRKLPVVSGLVALSRQVTTMAGSFVFLMGLLMLIRQPAIMATGPLFQVKITLGILSIGLMHMTHGKLKRVLAALEQGETNSRAEKTVSVFTKVIGVVNVLVLLLGVLRFHG